MAFGDERRANGRALEDARRANGQRIESERRSINGRMESERRGTAVVEDLNRLIAEPRPSRRLSPREAVGSIPASQGRALYSPPPVSVGGSGAGLVSPLTETPETRVYAPDTEPTYVETIDGSGYFRVRKVLQLTLLDAEGVEMIIDLDPES